MTDGSEQPNMAWYERFYDVFTERRPDACLDAEKWSPDTGFGDPLTILVRLVLALLIAAIFVRRQLKGAKAPLLMPQIPDLESENTRVHCLLFNYISPDASLFGLRLRVPGFPDRPCEYMSTGMWQAFIFTWPYLPRYHEPMLTQTGRETIATVVLAVQIMLFGVLGRANTSVTSAMAASSSDEGEERTHYFSITTMIAIASIYTVSIVGALLKEVLVVVYSSAQIKGGRLALGVFVSTGVLVGMVVVGLTKSLSNLSCSEFVTTVVMPFLMKQPLALVGSPLVYAAKNSFGGGPGVEGILVEYRAADQLSTRDELVEALRTRGRTVDNSWIATKQEVDAEEAAQLVATSAETSAAAAAEGHVLPAMMAAQPPQPGKSKPEEVLQLAHKSIDELRGLLKATAYVIASAPTLRAKHERYQSIDAGGAGGAELLLECRKQDLRKVLRAQPELPWRLGLSELDALLGRLPAVDEQGGAAQRLRVDLESHEDVNLRVLMREIAWSQLMDRRNYVQQKRKAKLLGSWYKQDQGQPEKRQEREFDSPVFEESEQS